MNKHVRSVLQEKSAHYYCDIGRLPKSNPDPNPKLNTDPNFDTVTETRHKTINLRFYSLSQPTLLSSLHIFSFYRYSKLYSSLFSFYRCCNFVFSYCLFTSLLISFIQRLFYRPCLFRFTMTPLITLLKSFSQRLL